MNRVKDRAPRWAKNPRNKTPRTKEDIERQIVEILDEINEALELLEDYISK